MRRNLAHVLPDGTLDQDFQPSPVLTGSDEFAGFVGELALDGTTLYLAGRFETVGGLLRRDLAAVDAVTGAVLPFDGAIGGDSGGNFQIFELYARAGVVYIGGLFTSVAGQPRPNAVALDGTTGMLLPWNVSANASVLPLGFGDGTIYVRGAFDQVNGQPRPGSAEVALYDPATGGGTVTPWTPTERLFGTNFVVSPRYIWAPGPSGPALTRTDRVSGAVAVVPVPGVTSGRSAAFDPTGGPNGTFYLGGLGVNPDGESRYPVVVALDAATGQPTGFRVFGATETNAVTALAVEPGPDGRLLAGGSFVTLGAGVERRRRLAAFDLTTGLPTDFAADRTTVGANEDLALSPDGRFLYGYSNVVGGAILDLTEFDLATGATRQFTQSRPVSTPMSAARRAEARRPPPPRVATNPRVENPASAVFVTDDRVCISLSGVACFDRATTDLLFYTPLPSVNGQGENNGDLLYLPPGGPVAGPGGGEGTLYVAAPIEEAPSGTVRPAFAALDYATGTVLPSWDVGFGGQRGPEGYTLALLDRDGEDGPAPAALYLGGDRQWRVQGQTRQALAAVDPTTAALLPWAPTVGGGPVLAMAAHGTPDGAGVVYVGGSFGFTNGVRRACCVAAFDATTGAYREDWQPFGDITFVLLASELHEAVFMGGFGQALRGRGHVGLVAVSPASPILPTADEAGSPEAPRMASLALVGPNPLRSRTALSVSLPEAQPVQASLYDVLGRRVAVLHDGPLPAGTSRIDVDASALPSGVYVARVSGEGFTEALTLTVVR